MKELKQINLWTALITPMHTDGSVHFEDLSKLCKRQEQAGNGVLILGSTGEALNLELGEMKEIVAYVAALKLEVPTMVGVGGINLKQTNEWVQYLETQNVDCYLMVTPLYAKPGPIGQELWFKTLLDTASRPCMLYNVPSRTGGKLSLEAVTNLKEHPQFWAIKEASGLVEEFENYTLAGSKQEIFSGEDGLVPYYAAIGCKGLVSVMGNVWPKATASYVNKSLAKQNAGLFPLFKEATAAVFRVTNPVPAKVALHAMGCIETPTLRPPLTHKELDSADELLSITKRIEAYLQGELS